MEKLKQRHGMNIGQGWNENNTEIGQNEHYVVLGNVTPIDGCGSQL